VYDAMDLVPSCLTEMFISEDEGYLNKQCANSSRKCSPRDQKHLLLLVPITLLFVD
jgi:hypothetical protein